MTKRNMQAGTDILIVEDDPAVRLSLRLACETEGYHVREAASGPQAQALFQAQRPNLVLLDLMLPEMSGFDICRWIRQQDSDVPVIILTARSDEIDKVLGLELGADDYVTKPFSPRELLARIRAVLRRSKRSGGQQEESGSLLNFGDGQLVIDLDERQIWRDHTPVQLTRTEWSILTYLAQNAGRAITRNQLVRHVWGYDSEGETRLLDSHIGHVRAKIEPDANRPRYIVTVRDVGYRFVP